MQWMPKNNGKGVQIMEYEVFTENGDFIIEVETKEEKEYREEGFVKRMLAYYVGFLKNGIVTDMPEEKKNMLIEKFTSVLSGDELAKILTVNMKTEEGKKEQLEVMQDLFDAYEDEEEYENITLNGNEFLLPIGFDIDKYKDKLSEMGEVSKGNSWRVSMESGEVVISE